MYCSMFSVQSYTLIYSNDFCLCLQKCALHCAKENTAELYNAMDVNFCFIVTNKIIDK